MLQTAIVIVALLLLATVAVVLAIAMRRPDTFRLQRSIRIAAPPATVFALVNDLHRWAVWSPWEKLDPGMRRTFGGAAAGPGATYAWEGSGKAGAGRMEIKQTLAPARVSIQLDFMKPFEAHNTTDFSFVPDAAGTEVTWSMQGPSSFIAKIMSVFISLDTMIGKDFERGLTQMKAVAEA